MQVICREGIPVINVRNIGFGTLKPEKLEFVEDEIAERLSPHLLKKEDMYLSEGSCRPPSLLLPKSRKTGCKDQTASVSVFNTAEIRPRCSLRPLLPTSREWMITNAFQQGTMASLTTDIIERIPLGLPPLQLQQRIIDILSPLRQPD